MDLELKDAVCFVAGSSRGIGYAIANRFLENGAKVTITGRNADQLDAAFVSLSAIHGSESLLSLPGDLSDEAIVADLVNRAQVRFGDIGCLVANVGSGSSVPGWDIQRPVWDAALNANLWPALQVVHKVLPTMIESRRGSVVVIGSITGLETTAAPLAYSAAKAALANYSKNLSRLVGSRNIRVNYVAPGNIFFPGGSWERHLATRREEVEKFIDAEVPLKRFGTVEEIADLVAFLSSPRASFITGATIVADGGQTRS